MREEGGGRLAYLSVTYLLDRVVELGVDPRLLYSSTTKMPLAGGSGGSGAWFGKVASVEEQFAPGLRSTRSAKKDERGRLLSYLWAGSASRPAASARLLPRRPAKRLHCAAMRSAFFSAVVCLGLAAPTVAPSLLNLTKARPL